MNAEDRVAVEMARDNARTSKRERIKRGRSATRAKKPRSATIVFELDPERIGSPQDVVGRRVRVGKVDYGRVVAYAGLEDGKHRYKASVNRGLRGGFTLHPPLEGV